MSEVCPLQKMQKDILWWNRCKTPATLATEHYAYAGLLFKCHLSSEQETIIRNLGLNDQNSACDLGHSFSQADSFSFFPFSFIFNVNISNWYSSSYVKTFTYIQETYNDLNFHAEVEAVYILKRTQSDQWYKYTVQIIHYLVFFFYYKGPYQL